VVLDSAFFMMFVQRFAGLGYNDGEVETYSSGGHGTSPRGIDINQLPSTTECEEETVLSTSSPSSIGMMKRGRQEKCFHEFDLERERACDLSSRGGSDDEDGGTTRKKLRLSKEQSALLEESFKDHITLSPVCMSAFLNSLCSHSLPILLSSDPRGWVCFYSWKCANS
jgi:hypothetical protein